MIRNLVTFEEITEANSFDSHGVLAMFIHQTDGSGNPTVYEVKQYHHVEPEQEQA